MLALTPTEAAALTGLDERAVRKDVEYGILDAGSPPRFAEAALVYLRACANFAFHLDARDRKRLYVGIADALARGLGRVELGAGWTLESPPSRRSSAPASPTSRPGVQAS